MDSPDALHSRPRFIVQHSVAGSAAASKRCDMRRWSARRIYGPQRLQCCVIGAKFVCQRTGHSFFNRLQHP